MLTRGATRTGTFAGDTNRSPVFVVQRTTGWRFLDLRELWAYRELFYFLTTRDLKVRYKQTVMGIAWAVLQPLAMMVVFTLLFGRLAKIPSNGIPYPLFAYAGLLPWQLFSRIISESTNSLVTDQRLISRVYFPRLIVPMATALAAIVDFAIGAGLLFGLMFYYRVPPSLSIVWLPLFVLLMIVTALGVGFWLSALNVEYRDVKHVLPFVIQLWFFVTPVIYPSALVPMQWRVFYGLNPMTGVVEGFRWALLGRGGNSLSVLAASSLIATVLFVSGIIWFRRRERTFVEAMG